MSYIQGIGTSVPRHSLSKDEFCTIYSSMTEDVDIQRKINFLTTRSSIKKRHCVEPDIKKLTGMSLEVKLDKYHTYASKLAEKAVSSNPSYSKHKADITDLIFVSCTGLQAPGVEIDLIQSLGLSSSIRRYNINFMGCYASLTAMRMAKDICVTPNRVVLVVSVELCTLHFQHKYTDDYLLSNSIFADGAASVIITSERHHAQLKLTGFESRILPDSKNEMSWKISPSGFLMTLSGEVPKSISRSLTLKNLFGLQPDKVGWAIHPGGKQIVDGIKATLGLDESEVTASRNVLAQNGNMSSATILFVIKEILKNRSTRKEQFIACAFGPGLTLESALIEYV